MLRDYYGILGVEPAATEDDIRHAYRRLAKLWHPDRFQSAPEQLRAQAERRMRLLTEAHATLSDSERRARYDRERGQAEYGRNATQAAGVPFTMPSMSPKVPGYQPSQFVHATTVGDDTLGLVIAVVMGLIALAAFIQAGRNGNPLVVVIAGALGIAASVGSASALLNRGPIARATGPIPFDDAPVPPLRHDDEAEQFATLVRQSLWDLPDEYAEQMANVAILVEREPGAALLRRVGVKPGHILLGLYEGTPLTRQYASSAAMPARITLFQGPIERYCLFDPDRIEHQVRATLLHEVAHHFGMDHDEMPIWVKA